MKTSLLDQEGAVIHPGTGEPVAIVTDASFICRVTSSTISRLAAEGSVRRWGRYVSLADIEKMKSGEAPKRTGELSAKAKAVWDKYNATETAEEAK